MNAYKTRLLAGVLALAITQWGCFGGGSGSVPSPCAAVPSPGWADQVLWMRIPGTVGACPTTYSTTQTITWNTSIVLDVATGKNGYFLPVSPYYEMWIKNTATANGSPIAPYKQSEGEIWFGDLSPVYYPNAGGLVYRGIATFEYTWGYPAQAGKLERDSLFMSYVVNGANPGLSYPVSFVASNRAGWWGYTDIVRDNTPGVIQGPYTGEAGSAQSWRLVPSWDTTGYAYQWFVNGVAQTSDTGAILARTFGSAGTYNLRVDQTLSDSTRYTVTRTYVVPLTLNVSGPSTLNPGETGTWSVNAGAGAPPYTYQWYWNGSPAGTGTSMSGSSFEAASIQFIDVEVTDANGNTGAHSTYVNILTGTCGPESPPGCQEAIRANAATRLAPKMRPALRRP